MTDDKSTTAGFWITVALVAVLVGYPLSFGPAIWLNGCTVPADGPLATFYEPLMGTYRHCPYAIQRAAKRYFEFWMPSNIEFIGEELAWFEAQDATN